VIKSEAQSEDDVGKSDGTAVSRKRKRATPKKLTTFEYEHEVEEEIQGTRRKAKKRQPAKRIKKENGTFEVSPPLHWEQVYNLTKSMRSPGGVAYPAVVDTMGCERLADRKVSPRDQRFQTLIALMLSSQTKDTVTAATIKSLRENLPSGLCLESILAVDPVELDRLIYSVGFHNNKTRFIKQAAIDIRDKFAGEIPDTIEGLTSLAGVGPKMGYLTLSVAWGKTEGIGVDVHVHRITNLWGWHKTNKPEDTRQMLESWLPREKWHEINGLLVGLGQTVCKPVGRECGKCTLAEEGLCPASVVRRKVKREVKVEVGEDDEGAETAVKKVKVEEDGEVKVKNEEIEEQENATLPALGDIEDGGLVRRQRPR
jgi:endonuclease-3